MSAPANTECECGRPKFGGHEACSRCTMLDGRIYGEARIIGALRQSGWLTLAELGAETGASGGAMYLTVQRLLNAGRLKRQWRDIEGSTKRIRNRYGGTALASVGNTGAWEYSLAMPKRRAA